MAIADRVRLAGGLEARRATRSAPSRALGTGSRYRRRHRRGTAGCVPRAGRGRRARRSRARPTDRTPSPPGRGRSCPRRRRCGRTAAAPAARAGHRTRRSHPRASAGGSAGRAGRSRAAAGARRAGRGSRGSAACPRAPRSARCPAGDRRAAGRCRRWPLRRPASDGGPGARHGRARGTAGSRRPCRRPMVRPGIPAPRRRATVRGSRRRWRGVAPRAGGRPRSPPPRGPARSYRAGAAWCAPRDGPRGDPRRRPGRRHTGPACERSSP